VIVTNRFLEVREGARHFSFCLRRCFGEHLGLRPRCDIRIIARARILAM
jgi:hypothetical protein